MFWAVIKQSMTPADLGMFKGAITTAVTIKK